MVSSNRHGAPVPLPRRIPHMGQALESLCSAPVLLGKQRKFGYAIYLGFLGIGQLFCHGNALPQIYPFLNTEYSTNQYLES